MPLRVCYLTCSAPTKSAGVSCCLTPIPNPFPRREKGSRLTLKSLSCKGEGFREGFGLRLDGRAYQIGGRELFA